MTERTNDETLTERMAMAVFHSTPCDEGNMAMLLSSVRKDDHEAIAQLLLSDHVLTDDEEAKSLVDAIYAGGEAG